MEIEIEQTKSILPVISLIAGAIGITWGIFKKQDNLYESYTEKYYLEVLEPLINKLTTDKIDIEEEYMLCVRKNYHCVPTYLNYMVHLVNRDSSKYKWEDVKKVILIDYLHNRPSLQNSFSKSIVSLLNKSGHLVNLLNTFGVGVILIFACVGVIATILSIIGMALGNTTAQEFLICLLITGVLIIGGVMLFKSIDDGDDAFYPRSIKKIEKAITSKVKQYNKLHEEYCKANKDIDIQEVDMLFLCITKIENINQ